MQPLSKKSIILPFLIGLYLMVLVFFVAVLKYDFLRSDVLGYWRESLTWTMPFHEHPPLYAWMIALVRTLTLNFFPPAAVMIAINLLAFGWCIFLVMEFFHNAGVSPGYAALAALLFGLWPFVGLT